MYVCALFSSLYRTPTRSRLTRPAAALAARRSERAHIRAVTPAGSEWWAPAPRGDVPPHREAPTRPTPHAPRRRSSAGSSPLTPPGPPVWSGRVSRSGVPPPAHVIPVPVRGLVDGGRPGERGRGRRRSSSAGRQDNVQWTMIVRRIARTNEDEDRCSPCLPLSVPTVSSSSSSRSSSLFFLVLASPGWIFIVMVLCW